MSNWILKILVFLTDCVRTIASEEKYPRLELAFGLALVSELGLGANFHQG